MRQLIIARKDLQMSPGKLAAQVSHASMAWLTNLMRHNVEPQFSDLNDLDTKYYHVSFDINGDIFEQWLDGSFTKTVCEAKNLNGILKAQKIAEELGLKEGIDYFIIKDNCLTELTPEEVDEDGAGRTTTCIGFRPLPDEVAHAISRKFQLYH